jgi:ribosomal protein S20
VEVLNAASELDRAAENGVIHRDNASRRKGSLMRSLAALEAED